MIEVPVVRLSGSAGLPLPQYATADAAGMDLIAAVPQESPLLLPPRGRAAIPTGLAIQLPAGYEGQVRPRSGLALHHGVTVLNAPGTIDADYRGEVRVLLVNLGDEPFLIERGARIAQLVIMPVQQARLVESASLELTARGAGGFGSTGIATAPGENIDG